MFILPHLIALLASGASRLFGMENQTQHFNGSNWSVTEPGGYLQWDEMDLTTFLPGVVNPSASKTALDEFMAKWRSECAKSGIIYK